MFHSIEVSLQANENSDDFSFGVLRSISGYVEEHPERRRFLLEGRCVFVNGLEYIVMKNEIKDGILSIVVSQKPKRDSGILNGVFVI